MRRIVRKLETLLKPKYLFSETMLQLWVRLAPEVLKIWVTDIMYLEAMADSEQQQELGMEISFSSP